MKKKPYLYEGGIAVDDRGSLGYFNNLDLSSVKRFYHTRNHVPGFVRAWHGHKHESKYLTALSGSILVAVVRVKNWTNPNPNENVDRYVLSSISPTSLFIPGGYAHGYKMLTPDAHLGIFSTASLDESQSDDFRYHANYWNVWDIVER